MNYIDAYAEWDDPHAFRVYLVTDDDEDPKPMRAVHFESDGAIECRLYKAAFCACPKDIGRLDAQGCEIGWPTEAPAKRVAAAVKNELVRIAKGEPGPTDMAMQIACVMAKPSARGK